MNPYEAYTDYVALKLHFSSPTYDYNRYNGKVKFATVDNFMNRRDRIFFEKLAKKPNAHRFLVCNLVEDQKVYIRDLVRDTQYDDIYLEHEKRNQAFAYWMQDDLDKFDRDLAANLKCDDGHPKAMKLYLGHHISLETLTAVAKLTGYDKIWAEKLADDDIAQNVVMKIEKYDPFMSYDRKKISRLIIDTFRRA